MDTRLILVTAAIWTAFKSSTNSRTRWRNVASEIREWKIYRFDIDNQYVTHILPRLSYHDPEEKMKGLKAQLAEQMSKGAKLDKAIKKNLKKLGFEI